MTNKEFFDKHFLFIAENSISKVAIYFAKVINRINKQTHNLFIAVNLADESNVKIIYFEEHGAEIKPTNLNKLLSLYDITNQDITDLVKKCSEVHTYYTARKTSAGDYTITVDEQEYFISMIPEMYIDEITEAVLSQNEVKEENDLLLVNFKKGKATIKEYIDNDSLNFKVDEILANLLFNKRIRTNNGEHRYEYRFKNIKKYDTDDKDNSRDIKEDSFIAFIKKEDSNA